MPDLLIDEPLTYSGNLFVDGCADAANLEPPHSTDPDYRAGYFGQVSAMYAAGWITVELNAVPLPAAAMLTGEAPF